MKKFSLPRYSQPLLVFLLCLPFAWSVFRGVTDTLDPDPGKTLVHALGLWSLRILLLALAITPLNRFTPLQWLPCRRTLGLAAFAYASLHVLAYAFFYLGLDVALLARELVKRPYIVVGATALLMLSALAVTSTRRWQRQLGRRWKRLHRLVYLATALVIIHFAWQVKSGFGQAPWYAAVFILLMLLRWKR